MKIFPVLNVVLLVQWQYEVGTISIWALSSRSVDVNAIFFNKMITLGWKWHCMLFTADDHYFMCDCDSVSPRSIALIVICNLNNVEVACPQLANYVLFSKHWFNPVVGCCFFTQAGALVAGFIYHATTGRYSWPLSILRSQKQTLHIASASWKEPKSYYCTFSCISIKHEEK